jgi:hypothetical protein
MLVWFRQIVGLICPRKIYMRILKNVLLFIELDKARLTSYNT